MYFRRLAENCQRLGGGTRLANSENTWCGGAFGFFLLLLALGVRLRFARIEVGVVVAVVVVVILVGLLLLAVALVLQSLAGEEEDGSGDDSLADVVPDLEIGGEECLCVLIDLSIWVVRNSRGIKEVEEAVCLDLLGDRPHAALALVLLLLLHLLHRQVLPLLPVNGATSALKDLRALK